MRQSLRVSFRRCSSECVLVSENVPVSGVVNEVDGVVQVVEFTNN